MLIRAISKTARRLLCPASPVQKFTTSMAPSRSPSPPSKRTKLDEAVNTNGTISHALPSSSTARPTSPGADHDTSLLPIPAPVEPVASTSAGPTKNTATNKNAKPKKFKKKKRKPVESGGLEDIMFFEVKRLLGSEKVDAAVQAEQDYIEKFEHLSEVELEVVDVSSHGEGLAINDEKDWIVAVPFCVPGERVLARIYRNVRIMSTMNFMIICLTMLSTAGPYAFIC